MQSKSYCRCPHKKKSGGVRSGELGGHSNGPGLSMCGSAESSTPNNAVF